VLLWEALLPALISGSKKYASRNLNHDDARGKTCSRQNNAGRRLGRETLHETQPVACISIVGASCHFGSEGVRLAFAWISNVREAVCLVLANGKFPPTHDAQTSINYAGIDIRDKERLSRVECIFWINNNILLQINSNKLLYIYIYMLLSACTIVWEEKSDSYKRLVSVLRLISSRSSFRSFNSSRLWSRGRGGRERGRRRSLFRVDFPLGIERIFTALFPWQWTQMYL